MSALDRAAMQLRPDRNTFVREFNQGRHAKSNSIWLQAGQVVGDDFWQHRNDPVWQINTGTALKCLVVQIRAIRNEVGNVGDVHAQFPVSVFQPIERNSVIEVARRFRVDRNDGGCGEVASAFRDGSIVKGFGLLAGILQNLFREIVWQSKLTNNAERIDTGSSSVAKDFNNDAFAFLLIGRKSHHFDNDFVVDFTTLGAGVADKDARFKNASIDSHESVATAFNIGTDETVGVAIDDFDDSSARAF